MFSKLMSQGARRDEANEGFGYKYDDELLTLVNNSGSTALLIKLMLLTAKDFIMKRLSDLSHYVVYFLNSITYL